MLVFELKISFLLIHIVYCNDSMWRPASLFTFGGQQECAYSKQDGSLRHWAFFFLFFVSFFFFNKNQQNVRNKALMFI